MWPANAVYCSFDINSDHYPVIATLNLKLKSTGPHQTACFIPYLRALSKPRSVMLQLSPMQVSTVDEFVYLGALIHPSTHSSPDILRWSALTCTAMQSLDKQLWRSRISLSTKLRLYNTCNPVYCRFSCMGQSAGRLPRKTHAGSMPSINGVSVCFSASSGITSCPMMKFDARPTNLYLRKLSRHGV